MSAGRTTQSQSAALLAIVALLLSAPAALSQSPSKVKPHDPGVVSDDDLTLVVGTRFVASSTDKATARERFASARIPLTSFNETDHCVDQQALEVAKEYFTTLGRVLGKAGHYYFVPADEIKKAVSMCERLHHSPPQAWAENKTEIIAFGQVLPTAEAASLEQSIR
jgi:hypothetical protein